jgi:hypothetical protein
VLKRKNTETGGIPLFNFTIGQPKPKPQPQKNEKMKVENGEQPI